MNKTFRVMKNAAYLFMGNVVVRSLNALSTLLLARYLGAHGFGVIGVATAFSGVATYFTDLGLSQTLMREGTKDKADIGVLMASYLKIRLLFSAVVTIISVAIILVAYADHGLVELSLLIIVIPSLFGTAILGAAPIYYQIKQDMKFTALFRSIPPLLNAIMLGASVLLRLSIPDVAIVYGTSSLIGGTIALIAIWRKMRFGERIDYSLTSKLVTFSLAGIIIIIMPLLPPLILDKVSSLEQVGFYAAVSKVPVFLYQIPGTVVSAFYPMLFEYGNANNVQLHRETSITQLRLVSTVGIAAALPFVTYPAWFTSILLGKNYSGATSVLAVLCWVVVLQSLNYPLADTLTTIGKQHKRTIVLSVELIAGIGLYIGFGHLWGALGAAVAQITAEGILLVGLVLANDGGLRIAWHGLKLNIVLLPAVYVLFSSVPVPPIVGMILAPLVYLSLMAGLDKRFRTNIRTRALKAFR